VVQVKATVSNNLNVMIPINPDSEEGLILYMTHVKVTSDFFESANNDITFGKYKIDAADVKIYSVLLRENNRIELSQVS
jgi:hypothetical protein